MNVAGTGMRVVVATRPVDFRKGHDGLAAVVEHELGLDPYFGGGGGVSSQAYGQGEGTVVGRDGTGAGIEASRAGPLCLADGARRGNAVVACAVRGVVRGSGLAPGVEPTGSQAALGGVKTGVAPAPFPLLKH